ncbi:hypothetical protein Vretifemale_11501, partial [Volvox reticuliferus]
LDGPVLGIFRTRRVRPSDGFVTQLQVTRLSGIGITRHPSSSANPPDPHLLPPLLRAFCLRYCRGHHFATLPLPSRLSPSLPPPCPSSSLPSLQTFVAEPPPSSPCH